MKLPKGWKLIKQRHSLMVVLLRDQYGKMCGFYQEPTRAGIKSCVRGILKDRVTSYFTEQRLQREARAWL